MVRAEWLKRPVGGEVDLMNRGKTHDYPDNGIAPVAFGGGYWKLKKSLVLAALAVLCASLIGNIFLAYKYKTKQTSSQATVSLHYTDEQPCVGDKLGTVKILFLGNSITLHPLCSYWWGEWGMAASSGDKDYVHRLAAMQAEDYDVEYTVVNFGAWELQSHDRAETLDFITAFLQEQYDYVIIQLGENITDYSTLESDYTEFISRIEESQTQDGMPADILIVGGFWESEEVDAVEKKVSVSLQDSVSGGIAFVDLAPLQGSAEYQSAMGDTVMGDDGSEHVVEHDGVSRHPGDKGMEMIAQNIFEAMQQMRQKQ